MSARCHHRNAEILEVAEEWISHDFKNGSYTDSWHNAGEILQPLIVKCRDCNRRFRFTQNHHPKWVDEMMDRVHTSHSTVQYG